MTRKNKILLPILHLMAWAVLLLIPYFLTLNYDEETDHVFLKTLERSWLHLFFYAIIFYINFLFLIDRYLFKKNAVAFFLINALLIALSIWMREALKTNYFDEFLASKNGAPKGRPKEIMFYLSVIASSVPIAFSVALKTMQRWTRTEAEKKEAANIKLQSEIQHLKYQLQPHFFFNSLNNIYSLVDISQERAKKTIHRLGKLMRYLLYETNIEKVGLQDEIDFMIQYIELMRLRFSEKISISYTFPKNADKIKITPLLFITLIENAFKHGIPASKEATLTFSMEIIGKTLVFKAINQNFPKKVSDKSGSGIGLENLSKRLKLLYPNKHTFTNTVANGNFMVILTLEI
ncbi:histidine kinase [Flagellimonas sp. 389]|uniref:sensor histidine kinase n=1 Tax=Flagellimonas sp. 389 TaxID=2835862 RepID=UPI001BD26310|nr:histidine kinase [Flagellimonas sp. 389]MBS9461931.1 histidine kinase [Flagellimonas sp. 389]